MENNVTSPQWKLIFQKINLKNLIIVTFGILIVGLLINFSNYSCTPQHMMIIDDVSLYEKSLDPEFCEIIVEKINSFNDDCEPKIEILDCG